MQVIPAIDLIDQQSVRLYQGDFAKQTVIDTSPVNQANQIAAAGFERIHIVDLDGAKTGKPVNRAVIEEICRTTSLKVEVGGGIRSLSQINSYLTSGVDRVILGSVALSNPELVEQAITQFGTDQIVVGIDGKNGEVSVSGWTEQSNMKMVDLLNSMVGIGVNQFIVTDIARDGTLAGPNYELFSQLQIQFPDVTIIASGGVSSLLDIKKLGESQIQSVIVGKAMATGKISLSELAEVNQNVS